MKENRSLSPDESTSAPNSLLWLAPAAVYLVAAGVLSAIVIRFGM